MDDLSSILHRIPQFASAKSPEITELTGGITNKNYKITVDGESYVLRMGGNETAYLGIDRAVEYECSRLAAQIGQATERVSRRASSTSNRSASITRSSLPKCSQSWGSMKTAWRKSPRSIA